jgi:glyoxylase-like metal-dependent hydrolase (beta-lactamase superfamily II)
MMTTLTIGEVSVTRIEESLEPDFDPPALFPDWQPDTLAAHRQWMMPHHYSDSAGQLILSIHSWLIRTRHHTILVDACGGNDKQRPAFARFHQRKNPYLENLRAADASPEDIDFVLCTHLHVDHVGWNTRLVDGRWVPTFPNAKYIFSRTDRDFWNPSLNPMDLTTGDGPLAGIFEDSVLPIIQAGRDLAIDGDHAIEDGLRIEPAPGHTPGHVILTLQSRGQHGIFSGDAMHHPIQVFHPDWNSCFCTAPDDARRSRRRILEQCSEHDGILMPAHFGSPHAVRVKPRGDAFTCHFG